VGVDLTFAFLSLANKVTNKNKNLHKWDNKKQNLNLTLETGKKEDDTTILFSKLYNKNDQLEPFSNLFPFYLLIFR
jgi:hypothetical protein